MTLQTISSALSQTTETWTHVGQTAVALYNIDLPFLEAFAVLVTAGLIVGTITIIIKTGWLTTRVDRIRHVVLKTEMPRQHAQSSWSAVQKHFFAGNMNDLKVAVMEADNILNDALRYAGIPGASLGEKLKNLRRDQVPNLEEVWQAHKLRNDIAHETNFVLKRDAAERALESFKVALKNLGVFDK